MRSGSQSASNFKTKRLPSRDFSDEKEIHSPPTSSREHANTVEDRFRQRVRPNWFAGLLRWRARTSCHTESGCDRIACANSHPVSNLCAAQHSTPVRWVGFSEKCHSASDRCHSNGAYLRCGESLFCKGVGYLALEQNTTSISNAAVGARALYENIADRNIAVGTYANCQPPQLEMHPACLRRKPCRGLSLLVRPPFT